MQELKPIPNMALDLFYNHVYLAFRPHLLNIALKTIERERDGEVIDEDLMIETTQVCFPAIYFSPIQLKIYVAFKIDIPPDGNSEYSLFAGTVSIFAIHVSFFTPKLYSLLHSRF